MPHLAVGSNRRAREQRVLDLEAAAAAARSLTGVMGFAPPSWHALAAEPQPEPQPEEFEIRSQGGWQHEAASRVDRVFRDVDLFSRLDDSAIAMLRSQGGPGAGLAVSTCPTCRITRMGFPPNDRAQLPVWPPTRSPVAITVLLVLGLGSWGSGATPWKA